MPPMTLLLALCHSSIVDQAGWSGEALTRPTSGTGVAVGVRGFRFPAEVITVAVRWYVRYGLSY
jgi:hypothetical protein